MGDRVLLITGASSSIGEATARAAAAAGWRVALAARRLDRLERLAGEFGEDRAVAIAVDVDVDVTDFDSQARMVAATLEAFRAIDAVFVNAGTGGEPGGFSGAPVESWERMLDINVYGAACTLRASLEALKSSRGHVVLAGSVAGRRTLAGSRARCTRPPSGRCRRSAMGCARSCAARACG